MSEKIYRVQMNSSGMPNFATAVEIADRQQGEWIVDEEQGTSTCSNCGIVWQFTDGTNGSNYCPNCGSKMRGEHDD